MLFCHPDSQRDLVTARRIQQEMGQIDYDEKDDAKYLQIFPQASRAIAADFDNPAECILSSSIGSLHRLESDVSLNIIASLIAQKQVGCQKTKEQLTYFIWRGGGENIREPDPLTVNALIYQNTEQLLELLTMLKILRDQVYSAFLLKPSHLCF